MVMLILMDALGRKVAFCGALIPGTGIHDSGFECSGIRLLPGAVGI